MLKPSQGGLSIVVVPVCIIILCFVGIIGYRIHSTAQAQWSTFHSQVSSAHFRYPSQWHVTHTVDTAKAGRANTPVLPTETAVFAGPHNFTMRFDFANERIMTVSCTTETFTGTPISINDKYRAVPLQYPKSDAIYALYLTTTQPYTQYCSVPALQMNASPTASAIFSAYYNDNNGNQAPKPAQGYYDLPEIKLAKAVFDSFQQ